MANGRNPSRRSHQAKFFPIDSRAGAQMTASMTDALRDLQDTVHNKVLRSTAHAGAEVLYAELKARTQTGPTGNLNSAIYQWFDKRRSSDTRSIYWVGVNKSKAPHWHNVEYGHVLVNVLIPVKPGMEIGKGVKIVFGRDGKQYIPTKERLPAPRFVPPHPYLRPTWDAKANAAVNAMRDRFFLRVRESFSAGPSTV